MDDYLSKLEKGSCMVLPYCDFLSKDTYAPKISDYGLMLNIFLIINWNNACLASNLSLKLMLWKRPPQTRSMQGKEKNQWLLVE